MKVSSQMVMLGVCPARAMMARMTSIAGGIAQGMDDAAMAVAAFARQGQVAVFLVEMGAPADQVVDLLGASRTTISTMSRWHKPPPAVSVSSMWFSKRSSGDKTPAMPPWA